MSSIQSRIPSIRGSGSAKEIAAYEKAFSGLGWIKTLYELAECGIFNQPDKTPINSVLYTNTGEVFRYLSYLALKANYDSEINDIRYKK